MNRRPVLAVVARPRLWIQALCTIATLVPSRWWARAPHLPVPDRGWLGFRLETAYGADPRRPSASELVAYLDWCREMRRFA